jgi:Ca2+-binding EF-hand superfamily protein
MHRTFRRTILFSTLATAALGASAWAQGIPLLAQMDSNHDGKVSAQEHVLGAQAVFDRMDANHDGKLTAQEMLAARGAGDEDEDGKGAAAGTRTAGAKAIDPADAQAIFESLDANHDGVVSTAEMEAAHTRRPTAPTTTPAAGLRGAMDANHDGVVTSAEHAATARLRFERLDRNHDGFVTTDEMPAGRGAAKPVSP